MFKKVIAFAILLIVLTESFEIKVNGETTADVDITTSSMTVPKGFVGLNISASIIGTFTLNSTASSVFLSLYFDVPGNCFETKSFYTTSDSFSVMNTVTCTIWTPITANQSITVTGYGWVAKTGNSLI
jgi:hypothetical protein